MDRKSILDMAMGAFKERADYEMTKIIDNILDENTRADKKRTLTISIDILPDASRESMRVSTTVKSKLEPTNPVATTLCIAGDENGVPIAVEMVAQVPGQLSAYGEEQGDAAVLKLVKAI